MDTLCFCKNARPILITWGYLKLILLLIASFPLYLALMLILFYGSKLEHIIVFSILISYPTAFSLDIALIAGVHTRHVQTLKVCFYYLIIELMVTLLLVPWIMKVIQFDFWLYMSLTAMIVLMTVLLLIQGVISILLLHSELKKLSDKNGVAHKDVGYRNIKEGKEIG